MRNPLPIRQTRWKLEDEPWYDLLLILQGNISQTFSYVEHISIGKLTPIAPVLLFAIAKNRYHHHHHPVATPAIAYVEKLY